MIAILPEHTTALMDTIRGVGPTVLYWIGGIVVVLVVWGIILGFCEAFGVVGRDEWTARDQDALDALDDADVIRDAHGNECSVTCPDCGKDVRYFVRAGLVRCAYCGTHEQQ